MYVLVRRALVVAALIALAGCSGAATTPSGSPGTAALYKSRSYTPYATLTNGIKLPTGLLITKP